MLERAAEPVKLDNTITATTRIISALNHFGRELHCFGLGRVGLNRPNLVGRFGLIYYEPPAVW